jgi:penicillin-binding protein 2
MPINQDNRKYFSRLLWLRIVFVVGVVVLLVRLWQLSIVRYNYYSELAESNQVRVTPLKAPRGFIKDREGRILVDNESGFNLLLFRDKDPDLDATLSFLSSGLNLAPAELRERLDEAEDFSRFQPVVLEEKLSLDDVSYVLSHKREYPELQIEETPQRIYRYGELGAHLLGYVGEISLDELKSGEHPDARPGDAVGKFGFEKIKNKSLTGTRGRKRVRVDSRGQPLEDLGTVPPVQGKQLQLTIDLDIQSAAEKSLEDSPGAVIAFDPHTGEILAMVSHPAFDPNHFATRISRRQWNSLIENPDHPLQNRVIQSHFSPGSIFKIVMALAGLEKGVVNLQTSVTCTGSVELYGHPFRCWSWETGGHGTIRLVEAIQYSCNVYFYLLGQKLGIREISEFSKMVGLGRITGIPLEGEIPGLVPSPEWKQETTGQRWYAGETISVAIGQGPVDVTPIQLARAIGAVATGRIPVLHLIQGDPSISQASETFLPFQEQNLQAVREGMWRVVNQMGTGRAARVEGFDVCGKTGTVQTIGRQTRSRLSPEEAARFAPNSWFVGFAPRDNPQIVVAVLVERGSSASGAAPAAGKVFKAYFEKNVSKLVDNLEPNQLADSSAAGRGAGGSEVYPGRER